MPDRDPLENLPGLRAFGDVIATAARREDTGSRRFRSGHSFRSGLLAAALVLGVTGTAATATVLALRATVITAPDPSVVPATQTPRTAGETVLALRSKDPAGQDPWALRRSTGQTGLTCMTVGQVRDGVFGIVGQDDAFRAIPSSVTDACGQGELLGARVVSAAHPDGVRSVVSGIAGAGTRSVRLRTSSGVRALQLGPGGSFVAAVRGYPEDQALEVAVTDARGRTTVRSLGRQPSLVPDVDGAPAWRLQRLVLGTRALCVNLRDARRDASAPATDVRQDGFPGSSTPTACLAPKRTATPVVADARRFAPGQSGIRGFDRWNWRRRPSRTVVWGLARTAGLVESLQLRGAPGGSRTVPVAGSGTFAIVLPARVDPEALRLVARLTGGARRSVIPGRGLVPDLVAARRSR